MNAVLRDPPAFFNRGPSPLARLTFFALAAILLMIADHHFGALSTVRLAISAVLEPVQRAAAWPVRTVSNTARYFGEQRRLLEENEALKAKVASYARDAQAAQLLKIENERLIGSAAALSRFSGDGVFAEVIYTAKQPFTRRIVVDRGLTHGVKAGMAVLDADGVVGQVTQANVTTSEITLVTEKDQSVPVLMLRTGQRAIAMGHGTDGLIEVPYMPLAADVREDDVFVTSGIDGTYPPGLAVARVTKVERTTALNVIAKPMAGVNQFRHVVILTTPPKETIPAHGDAAKDAKQGKSSKAGKRR